MNINEFTLNASDLGKLLNITARRVRQLAEEEVFPRRGRGQYPALECTQAYLALVEAPAEGDELRTERVRLLQAQVRRVELQNAAAEGTSDALDWQFQAILALARFWYLNVRSVSNWLYDELSQRLPESDAVAICSDVENWMSGLNREAEQKLRRVEAKSRNRSVVVQDYADVERLAGGSSEDKNAAL